MFRLDMTQMDQAIARMRQDIINMRVVAQVTVKMRQAKRKNKATKI